MSLTEKTLELNVTHELLAVADRLWDLISFGVAAPRLVPSCHCIRPVRLPPRLRPPFAAGLSLQDEKGQGWDVKLEFPKGWPGARAVFLQFKLGYHRAYSTDKRSSFHGRRKAPAPHCVFGLNNNSGKDQHVVLRGLAGNQGLANAVHYALPRVTNRKGLLALAGRVAAFTSFFSVREIDNQAVHQGLTVQKGQVHTFALDYAGHRKEIRSEPRSVDLASRSDASLVGDLVTTRAWRALNDWASIVRRNWNEIDFDQIDWNGLFEQYVIDFARAWLVPASSLERLQLRTLDEESVEALNTSYDQGSEAIREHLAAAATQDAASDAVSILLREREEVFSSAANRLLQYRPYMARGRWLDELPAPACEASVEIPEEGIEVHAAEGSGPASYLLF